MTEPDGWYVVAMALAVGAAIVGFGVWRVRRTLGPLHASVDKLEARLSSDRLD